MTDKHKQEDRINADLSRRLQEKLASVGVIQGKVAVSDKTPESTSEEC